MRKLLCTVLLLLMTLSLSAQETMAGLWGDKKAKHTLSISLNGEQVQFQVQGKQNMSGVAQIQKSTSKTYAWGNVGQRQVSFELRNSQEIIMTVDGQSRSFYR